MFYQHEITPTVGLEYFGIEQCPVGVPFHRKQDKLKISSIGSPRKLSWSRFAIIFGGWQNELRIAGQAGEFDGCASANPRAGLATPGNRSFPD